MSELLQFIIMLQVERHGSTHLPTYTVRIDDQVIETKPIPDFKTNDGFAVNFDIELEQGPHTLYVEYNNKENRGILRVENIYVGTSKGGFSFDQMTTSHSHGNINLLRGQSQYSISFTSPIFYWALSNAEI